MQETPLFDDLPGAGAPQPAPRAFTGEQARAQVPALLARLPDLLTRYRYRFSSEVALHAGLEKALMSEGVPLIREHVASAADRYDFLLPGGIVIEVKIKGSFAAALRQVDRYATRDDVQAVVLVTTRLWVTSLPATLRGKPLVVVRVSPAF